jgi:Ran GTPase-activating protein (RanGAP) involved in mRNA processing and transport
MPISRGILERLQANDPALTELDLWMTPINVADAEHLAVALKENTTLTKLTLVDTQINDAGAEHLAATLKENITLTELNLANNQIGAAGAKHLAAALKENTALTSLNLANNQIGDGGVEYLSTSLKENTILTELNLVSNQISAAGTEHLVISLKENTTLTSLHLLANKIGDTGAKHLANALKKNATLTSLGLRYNQIGDAGAEYLATALKVNTTLTSLDLMTNPIGTAGAEHLAAALKENYTLLKLELNGASSPEIDALLSRNAHIADCLKSLKDFTTPGLLDLEMINEAIETLYTLAPEPHDEDNPLPKDSYLSEAHRLLCALSYLQGGYLAEALALLESPIRHPKFAIIADKVYAEALMVSEAPEDKTTQVARYKLLAYCGRHDINSIEFATGLAGVSIPQDDLPDLELVHSVLYNPRGLPDGAHWFSYDELRGLAQSASSQTAQDSDEFQLLESVIAQKDYHPTAVNNCFHSSLFIHALRTAYPHQDTFQCLEGYLDLQHIEGLGGMYVLSTEAVIASMDNTQTPYTCVQDEITGLKQLITSAPGAGDNNQDTIDFNAFKDIVDTYKSTSLLGDIGKQLSTIWFLSWMISPTRSNTMLALQTLLKVSEENNKEPISKENISQAIEQSESGWFSGKHRTSLFRHEGDVKNNHTSTDEVVEQLANHFKNK